MFGEPAYPTIESKAAHLLYFVVKNHPFSDGNKRSESVGRGPGRFAPRRLSRAYVLFDGHEGLLNTRELGENVCVLASG